MKHHKPTKATVACAISMSFAYIIIGVLAGFTPLLIDMQDKSKNLIAHIAIGGIFLLYGIFRAAWGVQMVHTGQGRHHA